MENFDKQPEIDFNKKVEDAYGEPATGEMQDTTVFPTKQRSKSGLMMRLLFLAALVLLAIYFFKNGCNLKNTGNQQKAGISKPTDTYRLR